MKIFVTGGAGYVGSHCVRALCDAGHEVAVFDNLSSGHVEAVDPRATFVKGDLANCSVLVQTLQEGFDAVMHFAGSLDVNESVREPLSYYRNNICNSVQLLEVMHQFGIRKLIFSSTCATYGVPDSLPLTEEMVQRPINPYGRTKLAIEWALSDCADAWGLGATALRYFNAAGASADGTMGEDHDPEIHLIPVLLQAALGMRNCVKIFGSDYPTPDGTCVRDYIHVEDLATAHLSAIESQVEASFRCFNVGTGRGVSVEELVSVAREVTGHAIPAISAERRAGDPPELYADPSRIMRELNWEPKYMDISKTVATAWAWHKGHPRGFAARNRKPEGDNNNRLNKTGPQA